jgi:hypothetical protein
MQSHGGNLQSNSSYKSNQKKREFMAGMVRYSCNRPTQEAEAEGSGFQGQPGLQNETISNKQKHWQKINKT